MLEEDVKIWGLSSLLPIRRWAAFSGPELIVNLAGEPVEDCVSLCDSRSHWDLEGGLGFCERSVERDITIIYY